MPTTHTEPMYVVDGVMHYCVANMPGAVPITSTKALTNATLPYVEAIADHGLAGAVARDPALARGVNVIDGKVTYDAGRRGARPGVHAARRRPSARRSLSYDAGVSVFGGGSSRARSSRRPTSPTPRARSCSAMKRTTPRRPRTVSIAAVE